VQSRRLTEAVKILFRKERRKQLVVRRKFFIRLALTLFLLLGYAYLADAQAEPAANPTNVSGKVVSLKGPELIVASPNGDSEPRRPSSRTVPFWPPKSMFLVKTNAAPEKGTVRSVARR
jgi:hypothetical protein